MPRLVFEENYHVYWSETPIDDPAHPTTGWFAAADDVTAFIPKDGFNPGTTNNRVDAADLATSFDAETMGSHGSQLSVRSFMEDEDLANIAFELFGVRKAAGAFAVCWRAAAADGEPCFVWPDVQAGSPILPQTAANANQSFTAEFAVRAEPSYHAEVTSGS